MEPLPLAPLPAVLCTQEVAELLRLSPRSVLEMVKAGTLRAHRATGRRRYHFLADDVLSAVSGRAGAHAVEERPGGVVAPTPAGPSLAPVDPCDVWGAAPSGEGEDWRTRWVQRWLDLSAAAGLSAIPVAHTDTGDARVVGVVDVDGLAYQVLGGPRQRVRYLDDEGEPAWGLIDSVWVEPLA